MDISVLEAAIERAEKPCFDCLTTAVTLMEVYRAGIRGFTDSEIEYWAKRLTEHCDSIERRNAADAAELAENEAATIAYNNSVFA